MKEVWKPVVGFEGIYEVSNLGSVKSVARPRMVRGKKHRMVRERIMKPWRSKLGYFYVKLSRDNHATNYLVHRLVAGAFLSKTHDDDVINHRDGNKSNNIVSNLEWVTSSQNNLHAIYTGLRTPARGTHFKNAVTNERDVAVMRRLAAASVSIKAISEAFQISPVVVSDIVRFKSWRHVPYQ